MKMLALFALCLFATVDAQERTAFKLTPEDAARYNISEGDNGDIFVTGIGGSPPFKPIGGLLVEASQLEWLHTQSAKGPKFSTPQNGRPGKLLHVEFFADPKGNGHAVVSTRDGEPNPSIAAKVAGLPRAHVELSSAAQYAIQASNTVLLQALLDAGLVIDKPLRLEIGWNALHTAAYCKQTEMVKMLLGSGADRMVRNKYGERSIDIAVERGAEDICKLLAHPAEREIEIAGFPESFWHELITDNSEPDKELRFLSLNENDPPLELLKLYQQHWPNTQQMSAAVLVDRAEADAAKAKGLYRHKSTKEYGSRVEITVKTDKDGVPVWSIRHVWGPSLAGGGERGTITKRYGYWIRKVTTSWIE